MKTKSVLAILAIAMLSLLVAACGGDDDKTTLIKIDDSSTNTCRFIGGEVIDYTLDIESDSKVLEVYFCSTNRAAVQQAFQKFSAEVLKAQTDGKVDELTITDLANTHLVGITGSDGKLAFKRMEVRLKQRDTSAPE